MLTLLEAPQNHTQAEAEASHQVEVGEAHSEEEAHPEAVNKKSNQCFFLLIFFSPSIAIIIPSIIIKEIKLEPP